MERRTLKISLDHPGLEYRYETCSKKFIGICVKKEWTVDIYDLTDPEVRKRLHDIGFEMEVREDLLK